jgi:hypothetical protein
MTHTNAHKWSQGKHSKNGLKNDTGQCSAMVTRQAFTNGIRSGTSQRSPMVTRQASTNWIRNNACQRSPMITRKSQQTGIEMTQASTHSGQAFTNWFRNDTYDRSQMVTRKAFKNWFKKRHRPGLSNGHRASINKRD